MWILHLLPESLILFFTYCMIGAGAIGLLVSWFITFVPFINIYRKWIQIASILLLVGGIYWYGGYTVEKIWRDEVAKLEEKVREAEAKSEKTNTVIKTVYKDRVKVVKQDVVVVKEKIREVEKLIDKECTVSPEAINILNSAAKPRSGTVEVGPLKEDNKK